MSFFDWLSRPSKKAKEVDEAIEELRATSRQNTQIAQSASHVAKRRSDLMTTYAGAMQMMARGSNEDR